MQRNRILLLKLQAQSEGVKKEGIMTMGSAPALHFLLCVGVLPVDPSSSSLLA